MESRNHNISSEPMDIDLSGHSVRDMEISFNDSVDDLTTYIKTEKTDVSYSDSFAVNTVINTVKGDTSINYSDALKNRVKTEKSDHATKQYKLPGEPLRQCGQHVVKKNHINYQKPTKSYKNFVYQVLFVTIIIFISIFTYSIYSVKCCDDLHLENFKDTLSIKLFGQTEAIDVITNTLKLKERSKLLFFSGGTGVGKTYASSILLDTVIGPCSNVYHYTMPSFTNLFSTDILLGLTLCKMSLIIVDDLTVNDMHIKTQIREAIDKSEHLGKDITVILIYNCFESTKDFIQQCDNTFHSKLLENFSEIKALKRVVEFKPLSQNNLKDCINKELGTKKLDDIEYHGILKNFNVSIDGCKGVHSKIKYLNIV